MPVKQIQMYLIRRRRYSMKGASFLCNNGSWGPSTNFPRLFPRVLKSEKEAKELCKSLSKEDAAHYYNIRYEVWKWWVSPTIVIKKK